MTNIDEMLKTAQECANEADALRDAVKEISMEIGKIATLSGGYESENPENMRESRFDSGDEFTERITVQKIMQGYELRIETWLGWVSSHGLGTGEFFDEFCNQQNYNRGVDACSLRELQFIIKNIEGFMDEWYEHLKKQHATRKAVRLTAEKIAASLK
jgi:hypothetical protein